MDLKLNAFQHLGIPVSDLQQSVLFYARLGFENVMDSAFKIEGRAGRVSMVKRGDMVIELYQLPEPELSGIRTRSNGHIDHIAFDVDDIEATFHSLKSNGFKPLEEAPVFLPFWKNGCRYFNISGPDGERLEFNQVL